MTTTTGRVAGGGRRGNSVMAMPVVMPVVQHAHQTQQHRPVQFGTSWQCASPPSTSSGALSHIPISHYNSATSQVAQASRRNAIIAHGAGCSAVAAVDLATPFSAAAPRRCRGGSAAGRTHAPKLTSACAPLSTLAAATCGTSATAMATAAGNAPAAAAAALPTCASPLLSHHAHRSSCCSSGCGCSGGRHRWPVPARGRIRSAAVANAAAANDAFVAVAAFSASRAGSVATGAGAGPGPVPSGGAAAATRPPSPSLGFSISYFDGFCPEGTTEFSPVWEQLRWCSRWQQMRQVYDNLLRAAAAEALAAAAAGGVSDVSSASRSVDQLPSSSGCSASTASTVAYVGCAPGLLSPDETYAFLLQLQDFYHLQLDPKELEELQTFRCRLVRDLSVYVRQLDAEQLEALCCASAVSGKCLSRERSDAVQQRLLKILTSTSNRIFLNGYGNGNGNGYANDNNGNNDSHHRPRRREAPAGGIQVLTPALNTIFALYDHGYLPQVALLQAMFRQAVDHCGEVTRSQWHGLHGLARKFRFLLDDMWLEDLHSYLVEPLSCAATDFGRMASILGCISVFTVNKAMEALDTRVLVIVEAIERRYDEGLSLLTAHQLVVFTALLVDMQSPFRIKWLGHCLDHLGSCRSHLAGLPPATLVLAVELVLRGRGWDEQRLLGKLLRQLFTSYTQHPASTLRSASNVCGCPPRALSRIISFTASQPPPPSSSSFPSSAAGSLSAMAAAAAWDVDVGGAGGAASPALDLPSLVNWLASKVPQDPGPERTDMLDFLQPLVLTLVEDGRSQLASLEPRRLPGLIRAVAVLGVSPSRQWVSEAFMRLAGCAAELSGGELVAMLRLSHAQALPLPHATLDAVCGQHARIFPLMRAVDLCRLLECWVADRYIPSREQVEGFFDAVCNAFGIDLPALKAAAAGGGAVAAGQYLATSSLDESFDSDTAALPASGGGGGSGRKWEPSTVSYIDLELLQTAGGAVSAGAADGVAGNLRPRRRTTAQATAACNGTPPPAAAAAAAVATSAPPPTSTIAGSIAAAADTAGAAAAAAAPRADAESNFKVPSLRSLDGRPKGALLQPPEAQSMLSLLDQYRALLLSAKCSELLVVMNTYRKAVSAVLHDMGKAKKDVVRQQAASSRLLQALLRGGCPSGRGGSGSASIPFARCAAPRSSQPPSASPPSPQPPLPSVAIRSSSQPHEQ